MASYAAVSAGVMAVFRSVTPLVEPLSLDEAFLDVGGARRRLGRPAQVGEWIRARVADEQGITCSVGVAATKFLAKLASAHCKPDGLLVIPAGGAADFLHPLPVAALWGVGDRTAELLQRLGLRTVGDLARTPASTLRRALGPAAADHLAALAAGRDDRRVVPNEPDKSIGAEETFSTDVDDPAIVQRELLRLAERTAMRLRSAGQVGRTVSIKVRFADFSTISRSRTLHTATDTGQEIYQTACTLYAALGLGRTLIRLVGVRVEGISAAATVPAQLQLGAREHGWRDADRAVDQAAERYGAGAVRPAALVRRPDESERTGHFGATAGAHPDGPRPPTPE
jgi:DNA polymerase-4